MAEFNIDIPGVGKVTVQGNFATEDSINRLAASLKSGKVQDPINNLKKTVNETSEYLDSLEASIGKNKKSVDKLSKSFKEGSDTFNQSFSKIDGVLHNLSDPGSGALTKLVKTVGEAGAGLGKGILSIVPIIGDGLGTAFSSILGIATAITTEAIGFAQGLVDINKEIHTAGIGLAGGLATMQSAAQGANIPFQQFTKAMIDNTDSLRLMAGGAPGGILSVSKAMNVLTKGNRNQYQSLLAMGYTVEDLMGAMTDLGVTANLTGSSLNPEELAMATDKYLRSQQELNRLTGVDIKTARERIKAQNADLFIQKQLNQFTDPKARKAAEDLLSRVPETIRDFVASGTNFTQASGVMTAQMPTVSQAFRELFLGLQQGTLSQADVNEKLKQLGTDPRLGQELDRLIEVFGNAPGELYKNVPIEDLKNFRMQLLALQNQAKSAGDGFDYTKKTVTGMDKGIVSVEQAMIDLNSGLSTLGFTLFNFFDKYLGKGADAIGGSVQKFQDLTASLNDLKTAQEELDAAKAAGDMNEIKKREDQLKSLQDKINQMFGTPGAKGPVDVFFEKITGIFGDITNVLSNAIYNGFDRVLSEIIPFYTSDAEKFENLKKEISELPVGEIDHVRKYMLELDELTQQQLDELKIKKEQKQNWMGEYNVYSKIEPNISIPNTDASRQNITPELSIPNQALGNIFEPRSGGHIIRVAEAMEPEIVAPAERDPNTGKLGLTVSGVMLDNSQLLKNMLEANRNSTQLLAALNSRFEMLNKSMQDLVHEQKTANRLAV